MKNDGSIVIDRPLAEVFELTIKHVAEWSIVVVEDTVVDLKPDGGVGTTFRSVTEDRGRRMEFDGVVTKHDPPFLSAVHLTGRMFDIDAEYVFEDLDGKTRVTQTSNVRGKGFVKVMFFLFGWLMKKASCKATENELQSLKRFCEERIPQPA